MRRRRRRKIIFIVLQVASSNGQSGDIKKLMKTIRDQLDCKAVSFSPSH